MSLINGKSIIAMANDYTSIKEMLQVLGVEPTDEMVNEASQQFALNGNELTMNGLYDFLKQKSIMSKKKNIRLKRVADVRDMEHNASVINDLR